MFSLPHSAAPLINDSEENLVQTNAPLIQRAIDELRQGMFRGGYDPTKTVEENLESAMFVGALMNVIQKMEPTVFQE